jgi:hypothetical protein
MTSKIKRPANTEETTKPERDKNGRWIKGKSANPRGRPKEGQSWAAVIREVSEMTPEQVVEMLGKNNPLSQSFEQMPKGIPMKYLATIRLYSSVMFDPTKGIWDAIVDRDEGKVPDKMEYNGTVKVDGFEAILKKAYGDNGSK